MLTLAVILASPDAWAQRAEHVTVALDYDLDGQPADPDRIVEAVDLQDSKDDYIIAANPDVCRPVDVTITDTDASISAGTVRVTGTDCFGEGIAATHTFDGSGSGTFQLTVQTGSASGPYFATVDNVATDTLTGEGRADTFEVGYSTDCPVQYIAYGVRVGDRQGKRRVNPYAFYTQRSLVTTGGAQSTTVTSAGGDAAFASVIPGDLIRMVLEGIDVEVKVVAKASHDSITVDRPVTIDRPGTGFQWKRQFISSDPGDDLWFPVSAYSAVAVLFDQNAESSDGNTLVAVECRAGRAEILAFSAVLDGSSSEVGATDLRLTSYDQCRIGLAYGTGDDDDSQGVDSLNVVLLGERH